MTELRQVYKCEVCGNIVEIIHAPGGTLTCCRQPMKLMVENTTDAAREKHVPIIEKLENGVIVKVGLVNHPMQDAHYIEWIEIHTESKVYRKYLKPGDNPQAFFNIDEEILYAREYCNLHGVWRG